MTRPPGRPLRLGFSVKVVGRTDFKSNDARRQQQGAEAGVDEGMVEAADWFQAAAMIAELPHSW